MQLSKSNRTQFEKDFGSLDGATAGLLRGSSVNLKGGGFTGSGVIFTYDQTDTYILTAKHNLLKGQNFDPKKTPAQPSKMVDAFTASIAVYYGAEGFAKPPSKSAALIRTPNNGGNAQIFGDGTQDNWIYDVMMLKSADAPLLAYAANNAVARTPADIETLVSALSNPRVVLKRAANHAFIQIGFGYSDDDMSMKDPYVGKFQVRYTQTEANTVAEEVYDYVEATKYNQVNSNVVNVVADDTDSTAPGDSGGPLFALEFPKKGLPIVSLLGVTLGANQSLSKDKLLPEEPITRNSSNYLLPFLCLAFPNTPGC